MPVCCTPKQTIANVQLLASYARLTLSLADQVSKSNLNVRAFAPERAPRPENVAGAFYVDDTCIDCGARGHLSCTSPGARSLLLCSCVLLLCAVSIYIVCSCAPDTCRWMCPVFERVNGKSAVVRQPNTTEDRAGALHALLSCPT